MYVSVNGKLTKVTREEYERMVSNAEAAKSPLSKMDELINAVLSVEEAISGGSSGGEDANTTYTITLDGNIIKLVGSDGSESTIELPEETYGLLSQSWDAESREYGLTLTDKEETSVTIQYHLIKDNETNQIVLMAGENVVDRVQLAQDQDTKYTIEKEGNEIRLIPSDGSAAIPIELDPELNTTYELTFDPDEDTLTLTPNDNSLPQVVSLAKFADEEAVNEAFEQYDQEIEGKANKEELESLATKEEVNTALSGKVDNSTLENYAQKTEIPDVSGFAVKSEVNTELAKKADKEDVPSIEGLVSEETLNTTLQDYAKSSEVTDALEDKADKTQIPDVSSFVTATAMATALNEKADKAQIPDVSNFITAEALEPYATNDDVDSVSRWATDEFGSVNSALRAQIDILNKMIREIKYPEVENMEIDTDISASGNDISIFGSVNDTVRNITNANSVLAEDITIENGRLAITATEDVEFVNLNTSGTFAKSISNAAMSINNSGNVVIKESGIEQNSYNAIEIGLGSGATPKNVLIDNVQFTGKLENNAISIFGWQENAEIVISNCIFDDCSNPIRITNKTNVPAKIKFINCTCNKWDSDVSIQGFVLMQDHISATAEEAEEANMFANLEITFENCFGPNGVKIVGDAETLSDPENQVVYIWRNKGGKLAYDANKFPKISAF